MFADKTISMVALLAALSVPLAAQAESLSPTLQSEKIPLEEIVLPNDLPGQEEATRQVGIFLARGRIVGLVVFNFEGRSWEVLSLDSGHDILVDVGRQGSRTHVVPGDCVHAIGVAYVSLPAGETVRLIGNVRERWNPALLPIIPNESCP